MANGYELEGKVHLINDIQTFASGFSKREFVVEVADGKFPQHIKFECVKDKTSLTDGLSVGDAVKVFFDIRGNEYNGRYYVNLNAWKLERAGGGGGGGGASGGSRGSSRSNQYGDSDGPPSHMTEPKNYVEDGEDDIPF